MMGISNGGITQVFDKATALVNWLVIKLLVLQAALSDWEIMLDILYQVNWHAILEIKMKGLLILLLFAMVAGFVWADVPPEESGIIQDTWDDNDDPGTTPKAADQRAGMFPVALLISVGLEFVVIAGLYKPVIGVPVGRIHRWLSLGVIVAGATAVTISILWWLLPGVFRHPTAYYTFGELTVVLLEALAYRFLLPCPWRAALLLSTVANLASFFLGFFLMTLIF